MTLYYQAINSKHIREVYQALEAGIFRDAVFGRNVTISGDLTVSGTFYMGDAELDTLVLKGRVATSTVAGSAIALDASYIYGEGMELRYEVDDWTGIGSSFRGMYIRAQTGAASAGKGLTGIEAFAVSNDHNLGDVTGIRSYAYLKGTTAATVGPAYGLHGELSWDAGSSTKTITTEASAVLAKITGGVADTYTKIHGIIVRAGDMDGQNRTYGNGILVEDDSAMAGTITWTTGINLTSPATTGISISGATTTGISITGNSTDAIKISTGTITTAINVDVGNVDIATRLLLTGMPAGYTVPALSCGTYGAGNAIVDTTLIDQILVSFNMRTATNKTNADTSSMVLYVGNGTTGAVTHNKMQGILSSMDIGHDCFDAYAGQFHTAVSATMATDSTTGNITGLACKASVADGAVCTGYVEALYVVLGATGQTTGTATSGINAIVIDNASTSCNALFYVVGNSTVSLFAEFASLNGCITASELTGGTPAYLKCEINGKAYQIKMDTAA